MDYVVYKKTKFWVREGKLILSKRNISDISEIKGLENLNNLQRLDLQWNKITEIKGLEPLTNLRKLNLYHNKITEIKGLETLKNLEDISFGDNKIPKYILDQLGGTSGILGTANNPQKIVEYCRLKRLEKEILGKIKKMMEVSERINLNMMQNALEMDKKIFDKKIFEWAREFGFTINGDYLIINKDTVPNFIDALDKQFIMWEKSIEKIE